MTQTRQHHRGAGACTFPLPVAKRPTPVPAPLREILIERLEIATLAGSLTLTTEQWAGVLHALFPEDFREPPPPEKSSDTPPRSDDRIAVYEQRAAGSAGLWHPDDAAGNDDRRGMKSLWNNGRGARVTGWDTEDDAGLN